MEAQWNQSLEDVRDALNALEEAKTKLFQVEDMLLLKLAEQNPTVTVHAIEANEDRNDVAKETTNALVTADENKQELCTDYCAQTTDNLMRHLIHNTRFRIVMHSTSKTKSTNPLYNNNLCNNNEGAWKHIEFDCRATTPMHDVVQEIFEPTAKDTVIEAMNKSFYFNVIEFVCSETDRVGVIDISYMLS